MVVRAARGREVGVRACERARHLLLGTWSVAMHTVGEGGLRWDRQAQEATTDKDRQIPTQTAAGARSTRTRQASKASSPAEGRMVFRVYQKLQTHTQTYGSITWSGVGR